MCKIGHDGVEHEVVFEAVPPLIELEPLLLWCCFDGRDVEVSE